MSARIAPIAALLLGTAFLLAGSGLHGLLLPLRGQAEGFSAFSLGLLGTGWAAGFVAGCLYAPRLVRSVGHVRAFAAFASSGAVLALMTGIVIDPVVWIGLRICTGFIMAGAFMVIESWLNEKATNESRGSIFGLYMMVTYASIMAGQMGLAAGDVTRQTPFMAAGALFCLALIPIAMSTVASPRPPTGVSLDLKSLYGTSPVAFAGCFLIGVANGAWGTLGAVYGAQAGVGTAGIALMMSVTVIAGALMQWPAGRISDRTDRRIVLLTMAGIASAVALAGFFLQLRGTAAVISLTAVYGAMAYTLYSIAVAHANDHAGPEDFVKVSGGLLLVYGAGTMAGPMLGASLMEGLRPEGIFLATALAHGLIVPYTAWRMRQRAAVPQEEKDTFQTLPVERATTPEAYNLDPRGEEDPAEA
ncbi:MAG: MFS transporter [Phyllobacteriaceae bacterium]|nr:MFS transporter [Phyllobacteriaceae bacterium]MBA90128.1 MFS transporter [Phyllobacteriaceae bacterium]